MTVLLLGAISQLGCSPKQTPSHLLEFAEEEVTLPIRFLYGRPVVDVKVNGQGPFVLMLDTGATDISLAESVVKRLQLPDCRTTTSTNGASQQFEIRTFGADRIEMGTASLAKVAVQETDFFEQHDMPGIEGVWGMRYFGELVVSIDFPVNALHIRKREAPSAQGAPWLAMTNALSPEVSVRVGGKDQTFLIDTGSNGSLSVSASVASELPCYEERFRDLSAAAGSALTWSVSTRLHENVMLGSQSVERPYVSWFEGLPGRNLIGMEILRHFEIEFDLTKSRVRFLGDGSSALSFPDRRRLGISIGRNPQDGLCVVSNISSYRAAGDDIKIGDRVLAIGGLPISQITDPLLQEMVQTRGTLGFSVLRNGEEIAIDVPVHQDSFGPEP